MKRWFLLILLLTGCINLPVSEDVTVIVLNDAECPLCDTSKMEGDLGKVLNATFIHYDVGSEEGKALIENYDVVKVPFVVIEGDLSERFDQVPGLSDGFDRVGEVYKVKDEITGARWYIDEDLKKEYLAKFGIEGFQVDVFVLDDCPYAGQAVDALKEASEVLDVELNVHEVESELGEELGVTYSPMIFMNGLEYLGPRSPENFKDVICGFLKGNMGCLVDLDDTDPYPVQTCSI